MENKEKLLGEEQIDVQMNNNVIYFNVKNIKEFKNLITLATEQAEILQQTINRLKCFDLSIELSVNDKFTSEV